VDIPKIVLEFFQSLSLGHVVGKFLEVSQPNIIVLPVDVADCAHSLRIPQEGSGFQYRPMSELWLPPGAPPLQMGGDLVQWVLLPFGRRARREMLRYSAANTANKFAG
jgi:hypothetical protein